MPDPRDRDPTQRDRPLWATALAAFCAATVVFLVVRDVLIPDVRDTEVWLGFEVHGWAARITAPLHWAIFAVGAWAFWTLRPWVWPWASVYAFSIAIGHLVWNLTSEAGGGLGAGLWQLALFSIPAIALLWARPPAEVAAKTSGTTIRVRPDGHHPRSDR